MNLNLHLDNLGWLIGKKVSQIPSPNFNDRPIDAEINLCIIHCISLPPNTFGSFYIDALFLNQLNKYQHIHPYFLDIVQLQVSAHFYIERNGEIKQYVSTEKRAWHAGISSFMGKENCNNYSIGIELNGSDFFPYTLRQYHSLAQIILALMKKYPSITLERLTTHAIIAPGRKTDPGPAFQFDYLLKLISRHSKNPDEQLII